MAAYELKGREQEEAGALLVGRVSWDAFHQVWPTMKEFARYNEIPKYVVSTTLTEEDVAASTWQPATLLRSMADVAALKETDGGDIQVHGSATLAQSLAAAGLVDRYHLLVFPLVLGHGKRLFAGRRRRQAEPASWSSTTPTATASRSSATRWSGDRGAVRRARAGRRGGRRPAAVRLQHRVRDADPGRGRRSPPGSGDLLGRDDVVGAAERRRDRPTGFAFLTLRPTPYYDGPLAQLEELYVLPDLRDGGIGTALLTAAVEAVRGTGCEEMHINVDEVDTDTRRFYERHGFVNIEPGADYRMLLLHPRVL